jgi:putative two-component system response regulator
MTLSLRNLQVEAKTLVGLIDSCVNDFESQEIAELSDQLRVQLPSLLKTGTDADFTLAVQGARLIAMSKDPQPRATCVHILIDVGFAHLVRARSVDGIGLVEKAVNLAFESNLKPELRRALSVYSGMSTDIGLPARGVEYAMRAAKVAHDLNQTPGIAMAFANMTAALFSMGLYRETVSVGLRVVHRFKGEASCVPMIAIARANMASAALALQHYSLGAEAAREACEAMGLPRDAEGVLNRVATEGIWLKSAIGLKDDDVVSARMKMIRNLANSFTSPRIDLNCKLAEAAYEIYAGDLTVAVTKLLGLKAQTKALPTLYRDNLVLLVKAYEKGKDHSGALLYLGELVEFLATSQVTKVRALLQMIHEQVQTPMPGKDDVRAIIKAIQRAPGAHAVEVEVPESMYRDAFERLAVSAELREDSKGRHAYRVGKLTGLLALEAGYDRRFALDAELAARLHDIGKLGIPDGILIKPGKLTPAEFSAMRHHTTVGAQILAQCTHPAFRLAEQIAHYHHEKWDGTGYPAGLKGAVIPEIARIAALADVYDALTHARAYKHAWKHEESVDEMRRMSGTHFEPRLIDLFIPMVDKLRKKYPGDAFDAYLSVAGNDSTFLQARDKMHEMLNEMEPLSPDELL